MELFCGILREIWVASTSMVECHETGLDRRLTTHYCTKACGCNNRLPLEYCARVHYILGFTAAQASALHPSLSFFSPNCFCVLENLCVCVCVFPSHLFGCWYALLWCSTPFGVRRFSQCMLSVQRRFRRSHKRGSTLGCFFFLCFFFAPPSSCAARLGFLSLTSCLDCAVR